MVQKTRQVTRSESGLASVYAGGPTASGEKALPGGTSVAHRSIPFGTKVRMTNRANGKSVVVRINDRGPFIRGRIIDLMPATTRALGLYLRYTCYNRSSRTRLNNTRSGLNYGPKYTIGRSAPVARPRCTYSHSRRSERIPKQ
ncbi:MAG: septal ring lytic transglycosylase RlpA family protein [Sulfuritalea sp.]|nr:septal ring lytic transglycosylase RlpA family protein [Sulfuritalea sp.]